MTQHDDVTRLRHMLDVAREAVAMGHAQSRASLSSNRMLELALLRLVEVVGEAASRVSKEGQMRYPAIPWRKVAGMRNRLIHGYDDVDLNVLWDTVTEDLPLLIVELQQALESAPPSTA